MDDIIFPYDIYLFSIIYIHIFVCNDTLQVCTNTFTKELTCQKKNAPKKYMKHSSTVISSQLYDLCIQL